MIIWEKNRGDSDGGSQSILEAKENNRRPDGEAPLTLPLAPTLAPVLGLKDEAEAGAISDANSADAGMEIIRNSLEAIPTGSTLAFATDDLGALLSSGAPRMRALEFYRQVEHLAQNCFCSLIVQAETGMIIFHRE